VAVAVGQKICAFRSEAWLPSFFFFLFSFFRAHFLGEIIYIAPLDLGPPALNLRPARSKFYDHSHTQKKKAQ
jgi:hypothetical protein